MKEKKIIKLTMLNKLDKCLYLIFMKVITFLAESALV